MKCKRASNLGPIRPIEWRAVVPSQYHTWDENCPAIHGKLYGVNPHGAQLPLVDQITKMPSDQVHSAKINFVARIRVVFSGHEVMR